MCRVERCFDGGRIEQPEGNVQRFAEGPIVIVVDFSAVQDDAYPQLMLPFAGIGEPGVVPGQEMAEKGDDRSWRPASTPAERSAASNSS